MPLNPHATRTRRHAMTLSIRLATITKSALACLAVALLASPASAQRAGSWVDIGRGFAGSGASADGMFKFAKSKSRSKNGVDFGHGFAVGAGPNGIAISNSIGAGTGPLGAAHNVNLNIGAGGAHVSHGGVISEGGNRRVISGGGTGTSPNGNVYGGSSSTGFGNRTKAYSKSRTRQWVPQSNQWTPQSTPQTTQWTPQTSPPAQTMFWGPNSQPNRTRTFVRGRGFRRH